MYVLYFLLKDSVLCSIDRGFSVVNGAPLMITLPFLGGGAFIAVLFGFVLGSRFARFWNGFDLCCSASPLSFGHWISPHL